MGAEVSQYRHIFFVAAAPLDQADRALLGEFLVIVDGDLVEIDQFASCRMRSSISNSDIWQPKHPAREVVAILGLVCRHGVYSIRVSEWIRSLSRWAPDRRAVGQWGSGSQSVSQQGSHGAGIQCLIGDVRVRIGQAGIGIHANFFLAAASDEVETHVCRPGRATCARNGHKGCTDCGRSECLDAKHRLLAGAIDTETWAR